MKGAYGRRLDMEHSMAARVAVAFGRGTDELADEYARFFMGGRSDFLIRFIHAASSAAAGAAN
jgi:hypothetical protein